jgi:murein L,D-transpeptidase YcbB/YkuD
LTCYFKYLFFLNFFYIVSFKTISQQLVYPDLVSKLYSKNQNKIIWFINDEFSKQLIRVFIHEIDSALNITHEKHLYHVDELHSFFNDFSIQQDSLKISLADRIFSDAAIAYCKDIYQAADIKKIIHYDEVSAKFEAAENEYLIDHIAAVQSANDLINFFNSLMPKDKEYVMLQSEIENKSDIISSLLREQLITSLNLYRWVHHFNFHKYIVVNIASATLRYYENDSIKLKMKVVAGKPSTKTPRFAAYCNQVILYPYWNVPRSIIINELLPKFKENPYYINELNMEVLDAKGNVINNDKINWRNYNNSSKFPFRIRQSTGCDNSLGVIKFNLTAPLGVYLHDTNNKVAFMSGLRFYSHGCIRLEEPLELANKLLVNKLDSNYLAACLKDQVPITLNIENPVPVFVVYQTVEVNFKNKIQYFDDIYNLLK